MMAWRPLLGVLGWEIGLYLLSLWYLGYMAWGPREVLWSLWASSLLVGGITLLLGIGRKCFFWVGRRCAANAAESSRSSRAISYCWWPAAVPLACS